ncbi:MAG: GntR family transcriptional regulator [Pirellulales bacterium]|nr:GntR family transcriptional regulator [Pirellulales bacterium]
MSGGLRAARPQQRKVGKQRPGTAGESPALPIPRAVPKDHIPSESRAVPGSRALLKDRAYDAIKSRLQDARFPAGTLLSERQLETLLGMSKTPIKAALERLEQEGFVTISPQQGILVRELSIQEIADHFELRKALESYVVAAITGNLSSRQTAEIERNLRQQVQAAAKGAVARLVELDAEFHLLLFRVFGNQAMLDCLLTHRERMQRVIFQVMSQAPGRLTAAVAEHEGIFAAISAGKSPLAVKLLRQHLDYGKQYLVASRWS